MLVYLTTRPFHDWGENWPAWFQEGSVNHGLAGLMASCLSLMLIGVNWGCQYTVFFSVWLFFFRGFVSYLAPMLHEWQIILFAPFSFSETICSHHTDFHSTGLIFTTIQGFHLLVFVFWLSFQPPEAIVPIISVCVSPQLVCIVCSKSFAP